MSTTRIMSTEKHAQHTQTHTQQNNQQKHKTKKINATHVNKEQPHHRRTHQHNSMNNTNTALKSTEKTNNNRETILT